MKYQHLITTSNTTKPQRKGAKQSFPPHLQIVIKRTIYASKGNVPETSLWCLILS